MKKKTVKKTPEPIKRKWVSLEVSDEDMRRITYLKTIWGDKNRTKVILRCINEMALRVEHELKGRNGK